MIIIVILILLTQPILYAQNSWNYPIKPGTEQWKSLKTLNERIAVQQIPENILKSLSTEEVFSAWLELPGRLELLAFSTMQNGFEVTVRRYNVLKELLNRNDVGKVVLSKYLRIDPENLKQDWSVIEKGKFITDFAFIEFLLSQSEVLKNLSKNEKKLIVKNAIMNINKKQSFKEMFWEESGIILIGRVLISEGNNDLMKIISRDNKIKKIFENGQFGSKDLNINIYKLVLEFGNIYLSE